MKIMGKKLQHQVISKLKKINVTVIKVLFLKDVNIEKVLVSNKISSTEKNINTLFVACMMFIELHCYNEYFQKQGTYVTSYDGEN